MGIIIVSKGGELPPLISTRASRMDLGGMREFSGSPYSLAAYSKPVRRKSDEVKPTSVFLVNNAMDKVMVKMYNNSIHAKPYTAANSDGEI